MTHYLHVFHYKIPLTPRVLSQKNINGFENLFKITTALYSQTFKLLVNFTTTKKCSHHDVCTRKTFCAEKPAKHEESMKTQNNT